MNEITLDDLNEACRPGGSSCLTSFTELVPAGGPHASVAPATFKGPHKNDGACYAYERRFIDGVERRIVLIDSKQSQLNRAESALVQAISDRHPVLGRLPRVEVVYDRDGAEERCCDLELPHRVFDGHIRAGSKDEQAVTDLPEYRAARDASPVNARALLDMSPATVVFGGWDSSRASHQGRWRSLLVGEIIGICAENGQSMKGGARIDPFGAQIRLSGAAIRSIAKAQESELSPNKYKEIVKETETADTKGEQVSAARLGLGGIAPSLARLAGVACERILRAHVFSFAALRQIRFGAEPEGDVACRVLLAALALNALARSDAELSLRANCDLREAGPTVVTLDRRHGKVDEKGPLSIGEADVLLAAALVQAEEKAGVAWNGVALGVRGNPAIVTGAVDDEEGVDE